MVMLPKIMWCTSMDVFILGQKNRPIRSESKYETNTAAGVARETVVRGEM
jgi:hypothetical protein